MNPAVSIQEQPYLLMDNASFKAFALEGAGGTFENPKPCSRPHRRPIS